MRRTGTGSLARTGRRSRRGLVAHAVLAVTCVALLAGCGAEGEGVDRPEGSVALVQNQPTRVGGYDVVASNLREGSADVSVLRQTSDDADDPAAGSRVEVGETVTVGGLTFELVEIELAADRDGEPGSDTSRAWILPE